MEKQRVDKPKNRKGPVLQMQDVRLACGEGLSDNELYAIGWTIDRANSLIEASRGLNDDLSDLHAHLLSGGKAFGTMEKDGAQMVLPMNEVHAELPIDAFLSHWGDRGLRWIPYTDMPRTPSATEDLEKRIRELELALAPFAKMLDEDSFFLSVKLTQDMIFPNEKEDLPVVPYAAKEGCVLMYSDLERAKKTMEWNR